MSRVLVVDDDPVSRGLVATALEAVGHTVEEAADARAADEVLGRTAIDLIVTDVSLGGRSGIQMLHALRQDPRYAKVPAIVVSGFHDLDELALDHPGLFQTALRKPVDAPSLVRAVAAATLRR